MRQLKAYYNQTIIKDRQMLAESHPYIRWFLRFLMLPYCYVHLVNWKECKRNKVQVMYDLLYLFFKLRTFPDNYGPCRLWEIERRKWALYYGSSYHPFQRQRLRKRVQPYAYEVLFNDKAVCEQLCKGINVKLPVTVGLLLKDDDYKDCLINLFKKTVHNKLIIKPLLGRAGMGIVLADRFDNGEIIIQDKSRKIPLNQFRMKEDAIVQEIIEQDPSIAKISSASVNTIRVVTLFRKSGEVQIVSATMRFSTKDDFVDNWSAGGIAVGVDCSTGKLKEIAFDKWGNRYNEHPVSKVKFEDFQIPEWKQVIEVARKVQLASPFYRLIGMDIAIDKDQCPVLIEVNANTDLVFQEQTSGPLLEDQVVLSAFSEYDLLVNKQQRMLLCTKKNA